MVKSRLKIIKMWSFFQKKLKFFDLLDQFRLKNSQKQQKEKRSTKVSLAICFGG